MSRPQSIDNIRREAKVSRRLWVKVLGMLQQNWCVLVDGPEGHIDLVFFDDHGHVFDWLTASDQRSALAALRINGFMWMWESSSFFSASGMPVLPEMEERNRSRPIYSSGEYWTASNAWEPRHDKQRPPTDLPSNRLDRFVKAQDLVWFSVIDEMAAGRKKTHWMWFVFPQLRGLGSSRLAQYFGISEPREAADYWDDDVLGGRLRSCIEVLLDLPADAKADVVFDHLDAIKLRSCMTLFENVSYEDNNIAKILGRYFHGERCPLTLEIIKASEPARRMRISR